MLCEFIMLRCVPNDQTIIDNLEHASCRLILFSNGVSDVASANFGALSGSGYGLKRLKKRLNVGPVTCPGVAVGHRADYVAEEDEPPEEA